MKTIKSITIEELFGSYNHHIEFKQQEDITILLGQNGIGKTSILKILDMLFNHQLSLLTQIPFKKTTIVFDNDLELIIKLVNGTSEQAFDYEFSTGDWIEATRCSIIANNVKTALRNARNYISDRYKNDEDVWIDRKTGAWMTGEELVWQIMSENSLFSFDSEEIYPMFLYRLIDDVNVNFIHTNRLQTQLASVIPGRAISKGIVEYQNTLDIIAVEMKERLERVKKQYGQRAAELDQTYPYRLVENLATPKFSKAELHNQTSLLEEQEAKRIRLVEAGLLKLKNQEMKPLKTDSQSPYVLKAISIFVSDLREKFSILDEELERIELFRELINSRFLRKKVIVDDEMGIEVVSTINDKEIPLSKLSSGEQHLLVLYYDMIFRYPAGTLLLIDEPEISLHISCQKKFIPEMKRIMTINQMKAIIATHSPSLIGRYWGITEELDKDLNDANKNNDANID